MADEASNERPVSIIGREALKGTTGSHAAGPEKNASNFVLQGGQAGTEIWARGCAHSVWVMGLGGLLNWDKTDVHWKRNASIRRWNYANHSMKPCCTGRAGRQSKWGHGPKDQARFEITKLGRPVAVMCMNISYGAMAMRLQHWEPRAARQQLPPLPFVGWRGGGSAHC